MISLTGCSTLNYLLQAGQGQLKVFQRQKPLADVLKHPHTDPALVRMLNEIPGILEFVSRNGLNQTKNYQSYVQWDQDSLVYVVAASPKLKFIPKTWSFPIVGSFTYLGFFNKKMALELADELRKQELDVYLRGTSAYSTLGWFKDPLISTMMPKSFDGIGSLVNLLIHESLHATVYVDGQSAFNEGLANFVADQLTPIYLQDHFGKDSAQLKNYQQFNLRQFKIENAMHRAYLELDKIYTDEKLDSEKKAQLKADRIAVLQKDLEIKAEINNAMLIQYKTYSSESRGFEELFKRCGNQIPAFLKAVSTLSPKSFAKPQQEDYKSIVDHLPGTSGN